MNKKEFLMKYSKKYFLQTKLNEYKHKLQNYKHFNCKRLIDYEGKWNYLNKKYDHIILHGIQFVSIGETVPRLVNLLDDMEKDNKRILHVVLPIFYDYYSGGIYNYRLFDVFGKKIYFINRDNIDFWTYVFAVHAKSVDITEFNKYEILRLEPRKVTPYKPVLPFSRKEILEGDYKLKKMGVTGEFICLYARESNVKTINFNRKMGRETSCRDCDINTFIKTARYYASLNIQSVRMGKYEQKECKEDFIIDYANEYYDEFMDFYIFSKCKFLVGSNSGIVAVGGLFGTPVLITNMLMLCYGGASYPDTGYDLYIPKKFYSQREKRYLNLYEMLDVMDKCFLYVSNYRREGIRFEDNTEDEILEATKELNSRIDGVWVESDEERKLNDKYWEIMNMWRKEHKSLRIHPNRDYTMWSVKISYSFLKDNKYLLDVDLVGE